MSREHLPTISAMKKKADKKWSEIVHKIYNHRCAFCPETFALAAHHIRSRRFSSTRWNTDNGVLVCRKHHFCSHNDPEAFRRLFIELRGEYILDVLFKLSKVITKVDRIYMNEVIKNLEKEKI
jgi:hypothetical protein